MTIRLWPHRNLMSDDLSVISSNWELQGEPIGDHVDWQIGLDLELNSEVSIDLALASSLLKFDLKGNARIVVEYTSSTTKLRECLGVFDVDDSNELRVVLPGNRIGGQVTIFRRIVSDGFPSSADDFLPKLPGSILWEDEFRFSVEGSADQFPITPISFAAMGFDPRAVWTVRVPRRNEIFDTSFFDDPVADYFAVFVNEDHPLATQIIDIDDKSGEARLARAEIFCQIARGAVEVSMSDDFLLKDYAPGSLGDLVMNVISRLRYSSPDEIRNEKLEFLDARIQGEFVTWKEVNR